MDQFNTILESILTDVRAIRENIDHVKEQGLRNESALIKNAADIERHIKRTDLLETTVDDVIILVKSLKLLAKIGTGIVAIVGAVQIVSKFL